MPPSNRHRRYSRDEESLGPYDRPSFPSRNSRYNSYERRRPPSYDSYDGYDGYDSYDDHRDEFRPSRSRRRDSGSRDSRDSQASRRSSIRPDTRSKTSQALTAAVTAGAVEAFKVRKDPGPWVGQKGMRVASAAISAAAVDAAVDKDPGEKSKRHVAGAAAASLMANHLLNGNKKKSSRR